MTEQPIPLETIFNGALDAGNHPLAAECVLAHPGSVVLPRAQLEALAHCMFSGVDMEPSEIERAWAKSEAGHDR